MPSSVPDITPRLSRRGWLPVIFLVIVLAAVSGFVWRVWYYVDRIRSGEIVQIQMDRANEMRVSQLAAASATPSGTVDVTTEDDPSLGSADATLTIVEFADFGCPYSRQESYLMRSIAYEYGDSIRYIYRDFPLTDLHPDAQLAAEAGECAQDQGKFWELHDKMYQNQSDLSREALIEFARSLGMDSNRFISCLDSGVHRDEVLEDYQDGLNAGVFGTPTFFFNGNKIDGAIPADVLRALVKEVVEQSS